MDSTVVQIIVQCGALGLLALIIVGVSKGAKWVAPRIDAWLTAQLGLVATLRSSVVDIKASMQSMQSNLVLQTASLKNMEESLPLVCKREGS